MDSAIYRWFAGVFRVLACWFDESIFGHFFYKVCRFCGKCFSGSLIGKLFANDLEARKCWEASLLYRVLHLPFTFAKWFAGKTFVFWENLSEGSRILRLLENWELVSIRVYGVVISFFSVFHALFSSLLHGISSPMLLIDAVLLLLSLLMIWINRSLKSLFKGSFCLRLFGGLFCEVKKESSRLFLQDKDIAASGTLFGAFVGICAAVLAVFLPTKLFVMLLGGIFGTLFIFKFPTFGVFVTVIGSPVLPTTVLAGLCLLCTMSVFLRVFTNPQYRLKTSSLDVFVIFFMGALIYGTVNSFTFAKSAQILLIYFSYILFYFVVVATIDSEKKWKALFTAFVFMGGLVSLYGIAQNFIGTGSAQSWVDSDMFQSIKTRVYSTFDNPNVLGEFLVIMIPTTTALIWANKNLGHKLIDTFVILCMCACIVFTWSRGAWLGVMFAVALFLLIMDKRWVLAGVVLLFAVPFILGSDNAVSERILSIGNTEDTSTAYRVSIWQASVKLIRDFWVSGIGLGSEAFSMIYPKYALAGANFALHSHNLFLQICVEMGIIGIVTFFVLIIALIRQSFSVTIYRKRGAFSPTLVLAATAGILGYLLQGLTDNVWYNYKMLLIFWIVVGMVSAGANISKEADKQ